MRRLLILCFWLLAVPVYGQTAYQYTFTHDRLNTTFYQTCVDSAACISIGMPATNVATFILTDGTHTIKVQACNANGCTPLTTATGNPITVTVSNTPPPPPPTCPTIRMSPTTLPAGQVSSAYSQTLIGSGGGSPYSFAVTSGSLPAGLVLTHAGVLSGTPTTAVNATFTVTATDANSCTGNQAYLLSIAAAPPPPPSGTLLDWEFPTSASPRFAGSQWFNEKGPDGSLGWMGITGALSTSTAFSATATGVVRFDVYFRVRYGLVQPDRLADFGLFLLPESGSVTAGNSAGSLVISRSAQAGATAGYVKLQIQNGANTVVLLDNIVRGPWHKLTILATMSTKKSQIFLDDVLKANITWPNQSIVSVSRIGYLSGSATPRSDFDSLRVVAQ